MGYWNGYRNYGEWAYFNSVSKICAYCHMAFVPNSANQKYCSHEQDSGCYSERSLNKLPLDKWIKAHGQSVKDFISENGIELYNDLK